MHRFLDIERAGSAAVMSGQSVRISAAVAAEVRRHVDHGQARLGVEKGMAHILEDAVALAGRHLFIHRDM